VITNWSLAYFFEQAGQALQSQQVQVRQAHSSLMQHPQQAGALPAFTVLTTAPATRNRAVTAINIFFIILFEKLENSSRPRRGATGRCGLIKPF